MPQASKIYSAVLEGLTPRQREVLFGRFGFDRSGEPKTLAALGDRLGVTRERVRQIESGALGAVKKNIETSAACLDLIEKGKKYLKEVGGVASQDDFLSSLRNAAAGLSENHLSLFTEATKAFHFYPEDRNFVSFYYLDKPNFKNSVAFVSQFTSFLRNKKDEVLAGKYDEHFEQFVKRRGIPKSHAASHLAISKKIDANSYGDRGLTEWPEIAPKTIRDRVYLILKKKAEPLHFKDISRLINEAKLGKRPASAPTVHNELIKDDRFVLVGRGIYGLKEHGYEPGTAREVIHRVLKRQGPMRPKEVILTIQKERFFKPNTILVNLQNKSFFERLPDGTYRVRQA